MKHKLASKSDRTQQGARPYLRVILSRISPRPGAVSFRGFAWLRDLILVIIGNITPAERLYRRIRRQSISEWYRDYDKAGK